MAQVELSKQGLNYVGKYLDFKFYFSGIRIKADKIETNLKIMNGKKILFVGRTELMDLGKRWQLAEHLKLLDKEVDWLKVLTLLVTKLLNLIMNHEPPQTLSKVEAQRHYWLYPLLADPFTLIFAPGGSGKSYMALFLAMLLQNGVEDLVLETGDPVNVLYLDWETSYEDISRRFTLLSNTSDGFQWQSPFYRNMATPLQYEFDVIQEDVMTYDIGLVIIDSVVPAIGGNINNADAVGEFFSMLKQLYHLNGTRTLLLTHISKADKKDEKTQSRSPIGSVYFENYPRLVWELRSVSMKNRLHLELTPYKANVPYPNPLAFVFEFQDDRVLAFTTEIEPEAGLEEFIIELIASAENQEMKLKDITKEVKKELGVGYDETRRTLNKLVKTGKLTQPKYGYYAIPREVPEHDKPPF